jgi:hypothetical protein
MTLRHNILQVNLNRCTAAQDLLRHVAMERKVDIAIVAEPYNLQGLSEWVVSNDGLAGLGALGRGRSVRLFFTNVRSRPGMVSAGFEGTTYISCYFSPSRPKNDFKTFLNDLEDLVRRCAGPLVIGGDFNAKSAAWGSRYGNYRGAMLEDLVGSLGLAIVNRGKVQTCIRHNGSSIVDVTFCSSSLVAGIRDWRVDDVSPSLSDHRYIWFSLNACDRPTPSPKLEVVGFAVKKVEKELFKSVFGGKIRNVFDAPNANLLAERLHSAMWAACSAAMPKKRAPQGKKAMVWWTPEIAEARRRCIKLRRKQKRARKKCAGRSDEVDELLREAQRILKRLIRDSKRDCWFQFCRSLETDPWGGPYKVVKSWLGKKTGRTELDPQLTEDVVNSLFQTQQINDSLPLVAVVPENFHRVSSKEVAMALSRTKCRRAPGPDGIVSEVWKLVQNDSPAVLCQVFNRCLREGTFPDRWRVAKLVLLPKAGKPAGTPSAYRPLCLLDDIGKLFERILVKRIEEHLETVGGLSRSQFGFRKGLSTCDAVLQLEAVVKATLRQKGVCAAVSLDVKNAFNSIPWCKIVESLVNLHFPAYLVRILVDYFRDRHIILPNSVDVVQKRVFAGVPQGSVLGPLLWNIAFNGIFNTSIPRTAKILCYADDTLIAVAGTNSVLVKRDMERALNSIAEWLEESNLELAVDKSEAICFSRRRKSLPGGFQLRGQWLPVQDSITYLGFRLDRKWRWKLHLDWVAGKGAKTISILSRILPNCRGPSEGVRRLYSAAVQAVLLYGAAVWAEPARERSSWLSSVEAVQRRVALRVISGYRTVPGDTAGLLARLPPIGLLANERKGARELTGSGERRDKGLLRADTLRAWEDQIKSSPKGAWTKRLIPDLNVWVNRKQGQLNYYLTQLFTGHGYFGAYRFKIGKAATPACLECGAPEDDVEHTLIVCPAWTPEREALRISLQAELEVETLVGHMVRSEFSWEGVAKFAHAVLKKKEKERQE